MTSGRTRVSILVAGILTVVLTAPPAHAALSAIQKKCFQAIAKASQGFVKGKLKLLQNCQNKKLKDATSCTTPDQTAIDKLEAKLAAGIDKGCTFVPFGSNLKNMGYPGPCADADPSNGFLLSDLRDCIRTTHTTMIDEMLALEYDPAATTSADDLKCQSEIAKQSGALVSCVLTNVQKCRNDVMNGKLVGVLADLCAFDHEKAKAAIKKCQDKLTAGIGAKCTDLQIGSLKVCTPDQGNAADAASCLIGTHTVRVDGPTPTVPFDLVDYEYVARGPACGDNVKNTLDEECDGIDDGGCPGQCGTAVVPDGFFACLCKTKPRMAVLEHSNADTDNGWKGTSVDGAVPEDGDYLIDLYDCDSGTGLCIAGPNCSESPHSSCAVPAATSPTPANFNSGTTSDSICAALGQGVCRKERTATGPHCFVDFQKKCAENNPQDPVCDIAHGDFCATTFFGSPVPQAAGGVAVCNVSVASEDVVGTVNIKDGTSSVRKRQRAVVWNPISQPKPCPVCGGFCATGSRERCTTSGECLLGSGPCINAAVCSDGPRQDQPCRSTAPFAGEIPLFGRTSVDCPPGASPAGGGPSLLSNNSGLDIVADPRTTGPVSMAPSVPCAAAGFTNNTCRDGTSAGRPCTVDADCPLGTLGTCTPQCFCSGQLRPNDCDAACVIPGGLFPDKQDCVNDGDCPGGFCHPADCRLDPLDLTSTQEGICSHGPSSRFCSHTTFKTCTDANGDLDCRPPLCSFCKTDETCEQPTLRACFINSGIIRIGKPRDANGEGESAGIYCIPSNSSAFNAAAGFPGPGALIQRERVIVVGVPTPVPTPP